MRRALVAYGWAQVGLLAFCLYYAARPKLNVDTCAHPVYRTDGPLTW